MDESNVVVEQQLIITAGLLILLFSVVVSFILSYIGCLFLLSAVSLTFYLCSTQSNRGKSIGNLARSFTPPKTKWCTKIEFDHILVPADVDESLERLYERILTEHVTTWYGDLSQDEEFIQELRQAFRDVTTELLSRLARLDITEFLLRDLSQTAVQHLDSYLWARHHSHHHSQTDSSGGGLHATWLAFTGSGLHPALRDREAELLFIQNVAERLVPLLVKTKLNQSRVSSSVLTSILANIVLQPLLGLFISQASNVI